MRRKTRDNLLGNDSTKACSAHDDVPLRSPAYIRYLRANVLSFPITIRPYHECLRTSGFVGEVPGGRLRVLLDCGTYRRVEEVERVTGAP